MINVALTETQYKALRASLNELEDKEGAESCNDLDGANDKFFLLTKGEQAEAKKIADGNYNFSTAAYLSSVLEQQHPTERKVS
jgi:hypothetical protein